MNVQQLLTELTTKTHLTLVILTVALLLARVLPLIIFSPFLGGETLPSQVKIGLGVTLAVVLYPAVAGRITHIPVTMIPYVMLMLKEVFIGLCMAFVVDLVFEAARVAGTFIDTMTGASIAQVMVPQIKQQATLFASLNFQLAVVYFIVLDGHHIVIRALADSLVALPLDQYPHFSHGFWPLFDLLIRTSQTMLEVGVALSAPAFIASFLTDLTLGVINKVAPQIQVFFISMSIKPMVVLLLMLLALDLMLDRLHLEFGHMLQNLHDVVHLLT